MTREEFVSHYGMAPERARQISMNGFLKNLMYIAATALIFAVPVLLTMSFCLGWDCVVQGLLCLVCLFDFITVWIFVIAFADALE